MYTYIYSAFSFLLRVLYLSAFPILFVYREVFEVYHDFIKWLPPEWKDILHPGYVWFTWIEQKLFLRNKQYLAFAILFLVATIVYHRLNKHSIPKFRYRGSRNLDMGGLIHTQCSVSNSPKFSRTHSIARDVSVEIELWKASKNCFNRPKRGKDFCFWMTGRWADLPGPRLSKDTGINPIQSEQLTIPPNRRPYLLDIAIKWKGRENGYGYNNEAEQFDERENPLYTIMPGSYILYVRLNGTDMKSRKFRFLLENPGKDGEINLQRLRFLRRAES